MAFNYAKEKKLWDEWKIKEETELRILGFPEDKIQKLREYDEIIFKKERNYRLYQHATEDIFFINQASVDKKDLMTLKDLLDDLENEALREFISRIDEITYKIIDLKYQGYSVEQISHKLDIPYYKIYRKIKKIKKVLKKV